MPESTEQSPLEFRLNGKIPKDDHPLIVSMLNMYWDWLIKVSSVTILERIAGGCPIIAAYDKRQENDKIDDWNLDNRNKIPIVILETIPLVTEGNFEIIPKTYARLTGNGYFIPSQKPDTIMMVDLSAIPSRRGKDRTEVRQTVDYAKAIFTGEIKYDLGFDTKRIKHIWTYSPDISGILRMHEDMGARVTGYRIPDARNPKLNNLISSKDVSDRLLSAESKALHHVAITSYLDKADNAKALHSKPLSK